MTHAESHGRKVFCGASFRAQCSACGCGKCGKRGLWHAASGRHTDFGTRMIVGTHFARGLAGVARVGFARGGCTQWGYARRGTLLDGAARRGYSPTGSLDEVVGGGCRWKLHAS